jgi:hypothetical protein
MADKDLKVMIELAADAKGVRSGVAQATSELEKLKGAVSDIRGLAAVGYAMQFAQMIVGGIKAELDHITNAATNYSAAGMRGQAGLDIATMQSDQKIGEAFGPFVELAKAIEAQGLKDVAAYLVENKDAIGDTIVHLAEFGYAIADITAGALVTFSEAFNYLNDLLSNPTATIADTAVGITGSIFGGDSILTQGVVAISDMLKQKLGGK